MTTNLTVNDSTPSNNIYLQQDAPTQFSGENNDISECNSTGDDPGLILIFNQKNFINQDHQMRRSTFIDVNAIIDTFGNLGFQIRDTDVHTDLTRTEILNKLKTIAAEDHSKRNCLIIIMMTHGNIDNMLQAKDAPFYAHEIFEMFTVKNCPTLENKVKFFIFQACKGKNNSIPITVETMVTQESSASPELVSSVFYSKPLERDMLVAFAAVEGTTASRNIYEGSWFIQELCQNLCAYGRVDDVLSILTKTAKCVANNYFAYLQSNNSAMPGHQDNVVNQITKQMPIFISTLRKRFYLYTAERNRFLQMLEQERKMKKLAIEIETKIKNIIEENTRISNF